MNIFKKLSLSVLLVTTSFSILGDTQEDFEKALSKMTPEQQAELFKEAQEQMRTIAKESGQLNIFATFDLTKINKSNGASISKQVQKLKNATYTGEQKNSLFKMLPSLIRLAIKSGATVELGGGPASKDDLAELASNCQNPDLADIIILILELPKTKQTPQEWEAMVFESLSVNMFGENQAKFFEEILPQLTLNILPATLKTFFIDSNKLAA